VAIRHICWGDDMIDDPFKDMYADGPTPSWVAVLFLLLAICIPLGAWKMIELAILVFEWGAR